MHCSTKAQNTGTEVWGKLLSLNYLHDQLEALLNCFTSQLELVEHSQYTKQ